MLMWRNVCTTVEFQGWFLLQNSNFKFSSSNSVNQACRSWILLVEYGTDGLSRIHSAAQSDISKQQWVTGFHCVCVKCCRMVDSVPRWRLSLSRQMQSDLCWSQIGWYRLLCGTIFMARPSTFLENRSWWGHDCGKKTHKKNTREAESLLF